MRRQPTPPKKNTRSHLVTPEGMEKLKEELNHLWRVERPEITKKVTWAASLGDRSENADYHYNKKRLRQIDSRLLYLRRCIDDFKVIEYHPHMADSVHFGAWVEVENIEKKIKRKLRIVGYEELIGNKDYISMDSPMAKSLLHKKVGDSVTVETKIAKFVWHIRSISYEQ